MTGEEEEVRRETANGMFTLDAEHYKGFLKLAETIMRNKAVAAIASVKYVMDGIVIPGIGVNQIPADNLAKNHVPMGG
jgi:hypothetical protein